MFLFKVYSKLIMNKDNESSFMEKNAVIPFLATKIKNISFS